MKNKRRPNFTTNSFIEESKKFHKNTYDYSLVIFRSIKECVEIICSKHGTFKQTPEVHLRGHGCFDCGIEKTISHTKSNAQLFIKKSIKKHGDLYSYKLVEYVNSQTIVTIICKIHGDFLQIPNSHLQGKGCQYCAKDNFNKDKALTLQEFINRSSIIHNNKYKYDKVIYRNEDALIIITCPEHGDFYQTPRVHLRKCGCKKCTTIISKLETKWLDSLNIDPAYRQATVKIDEHKWFFVDAYDPTTHTVYEFNGDFWHGNPQKYSPEKINVRNNKLFGDLYNKTLDKEMLLKQSGYNIITMWENDFNA